MGVGSNKREKGPVTGGDSHNHRAGAGAPISHSSLIGKEGDGGVVFVVDGGGVPVTTGSKGYVVIPFSGTVTGWTVVADVSGSVVFDVKKCTYSGFPTTASIAGSEKPTLSSVQKNQDLSLSSWTTAITSGDIWEFVVDSVATVTKVHVMVHVDKLS